MKINKKALKITIRIIGIAITALAVAYLSWLAYATVQYYPTIGALEDIKNTRLTMQDVTGETLPPKRTKEEYDKTIEGLDENNNGIRDDVEHAIFEMEDDSPQMRAAKLQYAQALQLYFSSVRDGGTLAETVYKIGFGRKCIASQLVRRPDYIAYLNMKDSINSELNSLVFNNTYRKDLKNLKDKINVTLLNPPDEGCHVIIE